MGRINARLDDSVARKLDEIRRHTGQSTTDVVVTAIEQYHARIEGDGGSRAHAAFAETGFVGSAEGPRDLADHYKSYLDFASYVREGNPRYGAPAVGDGEAPADPPPKRAPQVAKRGRRPRSAR